MKYKFKPTDCILFFLADFAIADILHCSKTDDTGNLFSELTVSKKIRKELLAIKEQVWQSDLLRALV